MITVVITAAHQVPFYEYIRPLLVPTAMGNATGDSTEATAVRQRNNGLGIAQGIRSANPSGKATSAVLQKGGVKTTRQRALLIRRGSRRALED